MRVKRYIVETMPEALQKIRSDLGKDAVILNTKEIKSGGFFGFFGRKRIEVIAAIDNSIPKQSVHAMRSPALEKPLQEEKPIPIRYQKPTLVKDDMVSSSLRVEEKQVLGLKTAVQTLDRRDPVLEELQQMKAIVLKLSEANRANATYPECLKLLEERLLAHEIDPPIVRFLIQQTVEEAGAVVNQLTMTQAVQLVRKQLLEIMQKNKRSPISNQTKIVQFVGPTGVGKTTTIAKLAAEQVLKFNRRVGFITSDTYRIAAVEQLRTYATILNVPLEVVFSPQELQKAYQKLEECDMIFMDTAGRNYKNEMYVSELNSLLQTNGKSETYLVLSLTSKYKDMKMITGNFSKFKLDKLLFTKMDETDSYGSVINLVHDFPLQLSYITNGQNVPDDIFQVNDEQLVDLILEGLPDE